MVGPFTGRHLALIGVVVAAAALSLVALTSPIASQPIANAPASGASFYRIGVVDTGLAIGERPPPLADGGGLALVDLDAQPVDLAAYAAYMGRPVWVVLWASWCTPCQQEPTSSGAFEANEATGLEIIGVNVQESAGSPVSTPRRTA